MILRSIRVEGWRCFATPVEVGPFIDGLNIIHGPNGIGKSTLMMALARGLFDSHNVGGVDIKTLRCWGRSLAPKVTIEFEQNGEQFQLHKQFLSSPSARLERKENGQYVPVAESRAADERIREILLGEASARGATDQRHWGLAQILWATQGSLKIEQLASGTRATIQDALGAQIVGAGTEILEKRIGVEYGQFFTAKGKLKSGASAPLIVGLESQLEKANAQRTVLQLRLDEFESASRRIQDMKGLTASVRHSEQELSDRLKQLREQAETYKELAGKQKQYEFEVSGATEAYTHLAGRIESIRRDSEERDTTTRKSKQLRDDLPALEKLVAQYQDRAKVADQKVKEVRGQRSQVTAAQQLAQLAERYARNKKTFDDLDEQLKQIEATLGEIEKLRQSRERVVAPDKKTLSRITKVARQRDDARLKLDASVVTVSIQLESQTQFEISVAEETGATSLPVGDTQEIKGAPEVAFRIPGVGQFLATGPTGDFDGLLEEWESAAAKFSELTAGFGTSDLGALEKLRAQAHELDDQITQAEVRVNTLLGGKSIDTLRGNRSHAATTLDEIHGDHHQWKDTPPDPAEVSRQAAETEKQFDSDINRAEAAEDRAKEALRLELQKQTAHQTEIANLEVQAAAIEKRLESLRDDGLEDIVRANGLTELALRRDAAQGKLAQVAEQIQELGEDPSKSLEMLEGQLEALRAQADDADKTLNTESGRLEQIISEAPYSALAGVEEEIDRLEREVARQRLQIDAIRLLHETLATQKRDVMQSILNPIRLRANLTLQRISGSRFDGVHFDESLLPTGISPRLGDQAVSLDQISGGEQEQVHFAVRMALADIAFADERELVVLDDVFTYTDATRLARIATILDEAAERFQIVLLTCHPERYRGLEKATFFDLEKLVSRE